uniref:Disease resistance protein At4g27190-like leucine-rich repeats domain-containing protein n=1 Tax=Salix viminalis TaxID=40686 RepID=A0A6N2KZX5_SALVM
MGSLVSSSSFCFAPLPQPSPSYNSIFSALKLLSCSNCKSMKKLFLLVVLPYLVNLEDIRVDDCEKMEEIIGGTRSNEEGAIGEESSKFKLPKLRQPCLVNLLELKIWKCNNMEVMVPSSWMCPINLEEISVEKCEKMEVIIGRNEDGVMGEEGSKFKLPKLTKLHLEKLPELKSICSAKLICNSLEEVTFVDYEKSKRMGI